MTTTPIESLTAMMTDDDAGDDRSMLIRQMLGDPDHGAEGFDADAFALALDADQIAAIIPTIAALIKTLDRESLTALALSLSLCPLHLIDYAICFDDDDDACRAIRIIHPSHDT